MQKYVQTDLTKIKLLTSHIFPQLLLILVMLIMVILLSVTSPFFLTWDNLRNIFDHSSLYIILALGMTFVISSGGIDLSVGAVAALSGVCMAAAMQGGLEAGLSILGGLIVGGLMGAANGSIISFLKINPFIVNLGVMSLSRGLALIITGGIPIYGFPRDFTWWGNGHIGPFNPPMLLAAFLTVLAAVVLNMSRFGYYTLALGGNEEALRRSGVSIHLYKIIVYILSGVAAALGGLVVTARLNTAEPLAGWMLEMDSIAAVVLGGTSMKGGKGSVAGTVTACLLQGMLRNGLVILSIPSYYQQLVIGIIILAAVIIAEVRSGKNLAFINK